MTRAVLVASAVIGCALSIGAAAQQSSQRMYNAAKVKLERGEQIVGGTVTTADPDIYCAMANSGFDFLWIEMQHSPLTYQEVARMIWACRGAPAVPYIRVPDSTPGDIQKAMDIGALGIIIPLVDSVEEIRSAVEYTMYPPQGKRSLGNGQYGALYGNDYRQTVNDNVLIVAMIESPAGVALADEIASVPGVDVVFAASTDLGSFSGLRQGQPDYEALVTTIHDATLEAGRKLGGPLAWRDRKDFAFFQAPTEASFIRLGVEAALKAAPTGQAPIEGAEPR
jgi:2-keto-3-deoxy-L-rhamnonate aldolase RhmA